MNAAVPEKPARPLGITLFAILSIIGIVITFVMITSLIGVLFTFLSMLFGAGESVIIFILYIPIIIQSIIVISLFIGKSWARTLIQIFAIVGLVLELLTLNIFGVIVNAVILWYLSKQNVKNYFQVQ